jgi:hypothetical protein
MKLLLKQEHAVYYLKDTTTKEILFGGAAGGGKSALGVLWLIEQCQLYPKTRWLMGRSKLKTLKETTLNTFFELTSTLKLSKDFNFNSQTGVIAWNNGSEILLKDLYSYPADPNFDSLGSLEITGAFIDECNQISFKAWQIVTSRIRYKLNEYKLTPKILGTCNPAKNWTYSKFYIPTANGTIKDTRKFIQSLPTDNPNLPHSYLESLLALDENSKQRLYYGNWEYDNDPARLIDFDKIQNIFSNYFVDSGDMFISADIARYGSDKMVILVWSGFRVVEIFSLDKSSITQTADSIKSLMLKHKVPISNVIADEDGVGFVNNSKALKEDNTVVEYQNLKTQCYYKLAEAIQSNKIYVNCTDADIQDTISKELEQVKRDKIDNDGKLRILPKEKVKELIGHSPDYSDALAMRFYFELRQSFFTF